MAKGSMAWDRDKLSVEVAKKVAASLPEGFVEACIVESIAQNITDFKVEDYVIREVIKEAVMAKTRELLKTKFEIQVTEAAEKLAQKALANSSFR